MNQQKSSNSLNIPYTSNFLGLGSFQRKEYVQAISSFTRAIYANDSEPSYFYHRAESYLKLADFEGCILNLRLFQLVLDKKITGSDEPIIESKTIRCSSKYLRTKRLPNILVCWSQILLDQKQYFEGLKYLEQVAELGVSHDVIGLNFVVANIGLDRIDQALQHLYLLITNTTAKIDVYLLRARIYYLQGKIFFCNADLKIAIGMDPNHPSLYELKVRVMEYASDLKNKASEHIKRNENDLVIYYLNQAIELDPADWKLFILRGITLGQTGRTQCGLDDILEAYARPERDQDDEKEIRLHASSLHCQLAIQLCEKKEYSDAFEKFRISLNFNPLDHLIYQNRAHCYEKDGQINLAIQDYMKVITLSPDNTVSKDRLVAIYARQAKDKLTGSYYDDAIALYTKAIELNHTLPDLFFERARCNLYLQVPLFLIVET